MKSYVVYADQTCKIEQMPMPKIGEYDALVKMESCGVCNGTDMKLIHGAFKGIEEYPVVLGHEGVGRVVEKGSKVTTYQIGDLVLLPFYNDVPEGFTSGWGAYSEYGTVTDALAMENDGLMPDESAYAQTVLPKDFDPVMSAMIITFREVLSTMYRFGFSANKSLVVLGLGPVGLSFVRFAKLIGMGPVIAINRSEEKLTLAQTMGADLTINSTKQDVLTAVKEFCPDGVDFVLDAVGVTEFINTALEMIKPNAKICVYGISANMAQNIDWSKCPYNWSLHYHQFPSKKAEAEVNEQIINWIRDGVLDPKDFVSHVYDFEEIHKAFENITNRVSMLKQVIRF